MRSGTCMRCPYRRVRPARHARYFMVGEQPTEMLHLLLCDKCMRLFEREINTWVNGEVADVVSLEAARASKLRAAPCVRCLGSRAASARHARYLMLGEDPQEAYRVQLCDGHADEFDRDIGAWSILADAVELQPERARALRLGASEFGDDDAARIRELRERAAARRPRAVDADEASEVQLGSGSDEWRFSVHAQDRAGERNFTKQQVLQAAAFPTTTAPTVGQDAGPDKFYHSRNGVTTVVDRRKRIIVTVYNKREYDCQISRGPALRKPPTPTWQGTF
jgi:hypothetical protein